MILAVSDTGPLLHLEEANCLDVLSAVGDIHAPLRVMIELVDHMSTWHTPDWLAVDTLDATNAGDAAAWLQAGLLHAGEAEAIALARQINAKWLLTDDAGARLFASELGIEVHGSLVNRIM